MPDEPAFTIRPMESPDADAVQRLWTARFGGAPSTQKNWIEAALNPRHSVAGLVAIDASNENVVGFSVLEVGDCEYTRQYLGLDVLDLSFPLARQNGLFHLSCVQAHWEKRGIGSAFYDRRLTVLADRGVPRVFGIAWHRPHTVDSRVLFEKYDFACLATIERYYARTGARPHCPDCNGACTCTASLHARTIDLN